MHEGYTYSIGVSSLQAPSSTRRRVGAYLLHVCEDVTTPLSSLGIHQDLVTYGGFTPATSQLALVDGQSPPNFARPAPIWTPPISHALEFVVSGALNPASSSGISMGSSTSSLPSDVLMTVEVPNFGSVQIPPVVTLPTSPSVAITTSTDTFTTTATTSHDAPTPAAFPVEPSSTQTSSITTSAPRWTQTQTTDSSFSIPPFDQQNISFNNLLESSPVWSPTPPTEWDPVVAARLQRRRRERALATGVNYQALSSRPYAAISPQSPLSPARVISIRSPVRAPYTPAYGGPLLPTIISTDTSSPSLNPGIQDVSSSSEEES